MKTVIVASILLLSVLASGALQNGNNNKSLRFTKKQLFVNPYESCAVGDLNCDSHPDIVYGAYWFAGPDFVPRTFRPNHVAKEYMRANSDHIYDLDKDGWPDVIAGGWGEDGIYWYKNPGNAALERGAPWDMHLPWQAHLLARTRGHMEMFALHDFDKDGTPELHSASYRKHFPLEVWRFTKSVDGAPMLQPFVLGAEGGGHGYAFGDVNGDGREDVLCEAGWYERPAGDPFAKSWITKPPGAPIRTLASPTALTTGSTGRATSSSGNLSRSSRATASKNAPLMFCSVARKTSHCASSSSGGRKSTASSARPGSNKVRSPAFRRKGSVAKPFRLKAGLRTFSEESDDEENRICSGSPGVFRLRS